MLCNPIIHVNSIRDHVLAFLHSVHVSLSFRVFRFYISAGKKRRCARQSEGKGNMGRSGVILFQLE